jgi:hypothetical protein
MFVFDAGEELDLSQYQYELYNASAVSGTYPNYLITESPVVQGYSGSNVFTVSVVNTTKNDVGTVTTKSYKGRIRSIDTSGNLSPWSPIVATDQSTPLIDSQYINTLTASKITAGTIKSAEIIMSGSNSILKSSTYDDLFPNEGWFIRGDGHFSLGGPNGITYDNETIVIGSGVQVNANFAAESISVPVDGTPKLNINSGINGGVGGMTLGDPTYNYWYANGNFSVGSSTAYVRWNGTSLEIKGQVTATSGSFTGAISGSTIDIGGSDSTSFHVDINGNLWAGAATFNTATNPFSVTSAGVLRATNAIISGDITATSGTFTGTITGATITGSNISTGDIFIRETQASNYFLTYLLGDYLQIKRTQSNYSTITGTGAFLGYYNTSGGADTPYVIVNTLSPWPAAGGHYAYMRHDGIIYATNYIQAPTFYGALSGTASNATVAQYVANDAHNARFHWSGQSGQPTWLWGSNTGIDYYVWDPSQFNVASVGGFTPQTSGLNGGLAVRYSGDARLDSNYFVGYGTVSVGTGQSTNLRRRNADGYFLIEGSRLRYKENIENVSTEDAINLIKNLRPVKFQWKKEFRGPDDSNALLKEIYDTSKEYGFIAEEVYQVSPELVTYLDDNEDKVPDPNMWQQNAVISILVKTVQNLVSRIEYLESKD